MKILPRLSPVVSLSFIIVLFFLLITGAYLLSFFFFPTPSNQPLPKPSSLCGNGVIDEGESCGNCPQDFPEEECKCFNAEPKVIEVSEGENVYLCVGQSLRLGDYTVKLSRGGPEPVSYTHLTLPTKA